MTARWRVAQSTPAYGNLQCGGGRLLGYARVSTDDQKLDLQLAALTAAGVDAEQIRTDQMSGSTTARPGLMAVIKAAREGDVIVVWRLDRLGRSIRDLLNLIDQLRERGVGLRSLTEALDTETATGRLVLHVLAAIGEFERALIRERTTAGLAAARAKSRIGGARKKLSPAQVAMAKALLRNDDTMSLAEVAGQFGVSKATLLRYIPGGRAGSPIQIRRDELDPPAPAHEGICPRMRAAGAIPPCDSPFEHSNFPTRTGSDKPLRSAPLVSSTHFWIGAVAVGVFAFAAANLPFGQAALAGILGGIGLAVWEGARQIRMHIERERPE
ncbi:MAG TPA: recombinase family protein [Azospirillum sp.]